MTRKLSEKVVRTGSPDTVRRPDGLNTIPAQNDVEATESEKARIERLGRQRPEKFRCLWEEVGFIYAVVMSQAITASFNGQPSN